jgi:hypothetical protein
MIEHLLVLLPEGLRWPNLLLLVGALLAALLAAQRAHNQGIDPEPPGNQLMLGLLIGLPIAYGALLARLGGAGPALHSGALLAMLALLLLIGRRRLPLLRWLDVGAGPVLLGLASGQLWSYLAQGAAGAPVAPALLLGPLWDLGALGALLWLERRLGAGRWPGDGALLCVLLASVGHVLALGVAIAGACGGPAGAGSGCAGALQPAELLRIVVFFGCAALLAWRRALRAQAPSA